MRYDEGDVDIGPEPDPHDYYPLAQPEPGERQPGCQCMTHEGGGHPTERVMSNRLCPLHGHEWQAWTMPGHCEQCPPGDSGGREWPLMP